MAEPIVERFTVFPNLPKEIRVMIWEAALPGPRVVHLRRRRLRKTIGEWEMETGRQWPIPKESLDTDPDPDETAVDKDYQYSERHQICTIDCWYGPEPRTDDHYQRHELSGMVSDSLAPHILYVCRESYNVVSNHYIRAFRCVGSIAETWFNPTIDTLFIQPATFSYNQGYDDETEFMMGLSGGCRILDKDNVRRVKKLAAYKKRWEFDSYPGADDRKMSWVGELLEFFGHLEEFSLVTDQIGTQRVVVPGARYEFILTDPADSNDIVYNLSRLDSELPDQVDLGETGDKVDMGVLRANLRNEYNDCNILPNLPVVHRRALVSRRYIHESGDWEEQAFPEEG